AALVSLISQRLSWLKPGSLISRKIPKKHSGKAGDRERDYDRNPRDWDVDPLRQKWLDQHRNPDRDQYSDRGTYAADEKCFDKKLVEDLLALGSDGFAHAYLASSFGSSH